MNDLERKLERHLERLGESTQQVAPSANFSARVMRAIESEASATPHSRLVGTDVWEQLGQLSWRPVAALTLAAIAAAVVLVSTYKPTADAQSYALLLGNDISLDETSDDPSDLGVLGSGWAAEAFDADSESEDFLW